MTDVTPPTAPLMSMAAEKPAPPDVPYSPELLAPAGDWECARAAVENGADAIYFGLEKFNARMRADNFTAADLPALMEFLHRRGVRGYVTLNTLVFENELTDAEDCLRTMISAGVDAVIVQDVGICRLIRRLSPDFPIHASTQMTITSGAGVEFARELGCQLVVLARECSLKEIGQIHNVSADDNHQQLGTAADAPRPSTLPLEVFVHGALCVAYSGQCLTSEALGGRSANRGECAQACRMPYELISDGQLVALGDRKYLLSPQDLAGLKVLPELVRSGVASLKIEGRLKSPEYVANITRIYRQALDSLRFTPHLSRSDAYEMEMAFSRGLHTGWLNGINNQELVHGRFGKKRGVFLGEVVQVLRRTVVLRLTGPLKAGDGVVFDASRPEEKEEGGRVYEVRRQKAEGRKKNGTGSGHPPGTSNRIGQLVELEFGRGDIDFSRVHVGDKLWKTSDPELDRRLRRSFEGDAPKFLRPIRMEAHGQAGRPLTLFARDECGNVARAESSMPLVHADNQPLTTQRLREQLARLGGTSFRLDALENRLGGRVLLPVSELNRLRRAVVAELDRLRSQPKRWTLNRAEPIPWRGSETALTKGGSDRHSSETANLDTVATLTVLVRRLPQLEAALKCGIQTIYCDFENPKKYRDAVQLCRQAKVGRSPSGAGSRSTPLSRPPLVYVAPPRIFKAGEAWTLRQVQDSGADGYLVRNYDHLVFFEKERCVGDYSLNIANRLAADYFKNRFGLERLTPSYDLNFQQLEALLQAAPPEWFEVTIHQNIPMFHMEHCVFCAFLSNGTDYTNCGRPCDHHDVKLRDRIGAEHPVKADAGCRNTVFNARAQTGAEYVSRMQALGVRWFRVEFLNETPEQAERTIGKYRQLLRGEISGAQLWHDLRLLNQLGVTRGSMAG